MNSVQFLWADGSADSLGWRTLSCFVRLMGGWAVPASWGGGLNGRWGTASLTA